MSDENGINDWDGKERRDCPGCRNVAALETRINVCKDQFEREITMLHDGMTNLRTEFHGLRTDVQDMGGQVAKANDNLASIASTLKQLADLPEAWSNLKGFLAVTKWLRENIVLVAILVAVCIYALKSFKVVE